MSYYETLRKNQHNRYCCKYCIYWTFEKKDIKKHTCEDKKDMQEYEKEFKSREVSK